MLIRLVLLITLAVSSIGCASTGAQMKDIQIQQYQEQVDRLKDQVQEKNEEIDYLNTRLREADSKGSDSVQEKVTTAVSDKMTIKQVQTALKKAGFYSGPIDGKIGKGSKKAIKDFQKANGLVVDGVIGKATKQKLRKYLK